jgi:hypothetical protein
VYAGGERHRGEHVADVGLEIAQRVRAEAVGANDQVRARVVRGRERAQLLLRDHVHHLGRFAARVGNARGRGIALLERLTRDLHQVRRRHDALHAVQTLDPLLHVFDRAQARRLAERSLLADEAFRARAARVGKLVNGLHRAHRRRATSN